MGRCAFQNTFLALFVCIFASMPVTVGEGSVNIPIEETWDLTHIYSSIEEWESAKADLKDRIGVFDDCRGRLGDPKVRERCVSHYFAWLRDFYKLAVYASLLSDEDIGHAENLQRRQAANLLAGDFGASVAFFSPELKTLATTLEREVAKNPDGEFAIFYRNVLRNMRHIRTEGEEEVIAEYEGLRLVPNSIFEQIAYVELPWPTVQGPEGNDIRVSVNMYPLVRQFQDRERRKAAFEAFWGDAWTKFRGTLGATLYGQVQGDVKAARVRKYPSSRTAALGADNIPEDVYAMLLAEANRGLPTLHRYLKLRARMLGIDESRYYDLYPSIVSLDRKFSVPEGRELVLRAVSPLGDEYVDTVQRAFDERWIDFHPRPGKRGGAYNNGAIYDVHPYLLMNWVGSYEDVSTLAHEIGHAIHSHLANLAQPFTKARYSIFVAEIASTVNEQLLWAQSLKEAGSDEERLFYLDQAANRVWATFFRQASFAEFESRIHAEVESGKPLMGSSLSALYLGILRRYYGHPNVMVIDDLYGIEWALVSHFYRRFYVYQYATSIAAAAQFVEDILSEKPGAVDNYLDLLKKGGNGYPYYMVAEAGVDLRSPEPYRALIKMMDRILDQEEAIIDARK